MNTESQNAQLNTPNDTAVIDVGVYDNYSSHSSYSYSDDSQSQNTEMHIDNEENIENLNTSNILNTSTQSNDQSYKKQQNIKKKIKQRNRNTPVRKIDSAEHSRFAPTFKLNKNCQLKLNDELIIETERARKLQIKMEENKRKLKIEQEFRLNKINKKMIDTLPIKPLIHDNRPYEKPVSFTIKPNKERLIDLSELKLYTSIESDKTKLHVIEDSKHVNKSKAILIRSNKDKYLENKKKDEVLNSSL